MDKFIQIICADPGNVSTPRIFNTSLINFIDKDANGRAKLIMSSGARFPGQGTINLTTYEDFQDVSVRLASVNSTNPTALVTTADVNKAGTNRVADIATAQALAQAAQEAP